MKEFRCGELVPGCEATFQSESEDEILQQIAAHARDEHGMDEFRPRSSTRSAPRSRNGREPMQLSFGQRISGRAANGKELHAAVVNENEVRAAAGLTMVFGAVAFGYAYFAENYVPLQVVSALFFVEFLLRVTTGLRYSPMSTACWCEAAGRPRTPPSRCAPTAPASCPRSRRRRAPRPAGYTDATGLLQRSCEANSRRAPPGGTPNGDLHGQFRP
jgi:predicted small metal-binding protein